MQYLAEFIIKDADKIINSKPDNALQVLIKYNIGIKSFCK